MTRTEFDAITDLLRKHLKGELTEGEQLQLEKWKNQSEKNTQLVHTVTDAAAFAEELRFFFQAEANILQKIKNRLPALQEAVPAIPVRTSFLKRRMTVAAAVILLLSGAAWLWQRNRSTYKGVQRQEAVVQDVAPGKTGAILTLADGKQVVLDSIANGTVAIQHGMEVTIKNGQLVYDLQNSPEGELAYNTMATPVGRQFSLVLPDGTRVWLNAASSIKYPVSFTGQERRVTLSGEAYFEVAANKKMPFKVESGKAEVQVLGTSFNIHSYTDEDRFFATLLEGSVQVKNQLLANQAPAILKPGQQAIVFTGTGNQQQAIVVTENTDLDKVLAWKNGFFNFEEASLDEVMKQLQRWYDIEVVYERGVPGIRFFGKISRNVKLSGVLKALEESKVHFRLENGRRLVVLP
jgi:ferric-dicitrate binding protein FerR (iron transport regulator)